MPRRKWSQWAQSRPAAVWVGEGVIVAALCCFAVSAYFNARYAGSLGQDDNMQTAMKIAGLAIASLLALLAVGKHLIDTERFGGVKSKAIILVLCLAMVEVWSAMGSIVTGRSDMVGSRKIEATAVANATEDRARLQSELNALAKRKLQPAGTLLAQMQGMQGQVFYAETRGCTINTGAYRNSCSRYQSTAQQYGFADRKEKLEAQLAAATGTIAHARGSAQSAADPQSAAMATTLGFMGIMANPDTIGLLAPLGIALVLMLAGWWGIEIGFAIRGIELAVAARPTAATNDNVRQFQTPPASTSSHMNIPSHSAGAFGYGPAFSGQLEFAGPSKTSMAKVA